MDKNILIYITLQLSINDINFCERNVLLHTPMICDLMHLVDSTNGNGIKLIKSIIDIYHALLDMIY